jgi:hypothetical protein
MLDLVRWFNGRISLMYSGGDSSLREALPFASRTAELSVEGCVLPCRPFALRRALVFMSTSRPLIPIESNTQYALRHRSKKYDM